MIITAQHFTSKPSSAAHWKKWCRKGLLPHSLSIKAPHKQAAAWIAYGDVGKRVRNPGFLFLRQMRWQQGVHSPPQTPVSTRDVLPMSGKDGFMEETIYSTQINVL